MGWARRSGAGIVAVLVVALGPGCWVAAPARPPAPARASAGGARAAPSGGGPEVDGDLAAPRSGSEIRGGSAAASEEPDMLPASTDEAPTDETPGEGPPPPPSLDREGLPAPSRYARLDRARCEEELGRRHVPYERVDDARGVVAPLRLTGPLAGVTFRSSLPPSKSRTSPYDIYDCRLVLALDDFARVLARHDIVEVVHLSVYRPVPARVPLKGAGRRHGGALAIDAALFKTRDGRTLSVKKDFHGRLGARPCPAPATASELRKIACEAGEARLFNVLLTPDYNRAHRNHFHLEVTAGVRWTLVR